MATLKQKIKAEASGRKMLEESGIPQPDDVEYGHTCIRFLWNEQKVALVIEIDEPPEDFETVGDYVGNLDEVKEFADLIDLEQVRGLAGLADPEGPTDPDDDPDIVGLVDLEDEAA
jgi:hypothetical protein